ncbi:MAG TPA: PDZ domain-containing protein [Candidatus Sulfotelmatobacter sp.]|nr:PDZ domain-containing protein [Candidatus Sulfotelmatobacter sp.]
MRFRILIALVLVTAAIAQDAPKAAPQPAAKSVTVPITLDHNRVVIDVYLALPDGSTKRIRGWVDNGNPDLEMSRHAATLLGLNVTCDDKACSAPPPAEITLGATKTGDATTSGMKISLANIKEAKIPLKPVSAAAVAFPGMSAEINIPSSILRHYDVLVDFPDREFTIAQPGTLKFKGVTSKALINAENGLIQIPSQIENKKYNLALDVGASISFLSEELFDKLQTAHPDLPHMTSAVGPANMWGLDEEPKWKLLRVDRLQFGPLYLTSLAMADFLREGMAWFEKRAGVATIGLLGANALLNYRVGLDYAHATVYFDIGSTFKAPDFDVIGFTLRPEDDGRFTILGIADIEGKPSVPGPPDGVRPGDHLVAVDGVPVPDSTMGQVWSLLEGTPGQERKLTLERDGKKFDVTAKVRHFLGEPPEEKDSKKKSSRKN